MSPIDRAASVSDLRSFQIKIPPHLRKHPPWKLSNQIWDVFNEPSRPLASAPSSPGISAPEASIAEQIPSADNTWDWFSNSPRPLQRSSFRGGSVLLSERANIESEQRPQAYGFVRDPILEGDVIPNAVEKKRFPDASHRIFSTGVECKPSPRLRVPRPTYDSTRAGVRTDLQPSFRPCFRPVPVPASYHQERTPRPPPRSHLWRSRDIITQKDPEFVPTPTRSIKTFPMHLRCGSDEQGFRPAKRLLRPSESETALRTMHYCMPAPDDDLGKPVRRADKNRNMAGDVINYRFSGGICPQTMKLVDWQEENEEYEKALNLSYQTDVVNTHQLFLDNVERARRRTSIY